MRMEKREAGGKENSREGKQQGRREGAEHERQRGIRILLESCRDMNATYDFTLQQLKKKYDLLEDRAKEYLDQFWNTKQEPL